MADDSRTVRVATEIATGFHGGNTGDDLVRGSSTLYRVTVKCPVCGKVVEAAEMPNGSIVYIGTSMVPMGHRFRRYHVGNDRYPVVIRTRSQLGYPLHDHDTNESSGQG